MNPGFCSSLGMAPVARCSACGKVLSYDGASHHCVPIDTGPGAFNRSDSSESFNEFLRRIEYVVNLGSTRPPASCLPADAKARKAVPVATGFVDYFPDAIAAVAAVSKIGGEQHNPGKPLFWDRSKSTDEADCLMRHFIQRGTMDTDGARHSAKVAWRALALLQKEIEAERNAKG